MKKYDKKIEDYSRSPTDLYSEYIKKDAVAAIIGEFGKKPNQSTTVKSHQEVDPKTNRMKWVQKKCSLVDAVAEGIDNAVLWFGAGKKNQTASRPPPAQLYEKWRKINADCRALMKSMGLVGGSIEMPWPLQEDWKTQLRGLNNPHIKLKEFSSNLCMVAITSKLLADKYKAVKGKDNRHPPDLATATLFDSLANIKKRYLPRVGSQENFIVLVLEALNRQQELANNPKIIEVIPSKDTLKKRIDRQRKGTQKRANAI